jgi:hypothetical protein
MKDSVQYIYIYIRKTDTNSVKAHRSARLKSNQGSKHAEYSRSVIETN